MQSLTHSASSCPAKRFPNKREQLKADHQNNQPNKAVPISFNYLATLNTMVSVPKISQLPHIIRAGWGGAIGLLTSSPAYLCEFLVVLVIGDAGEAPSTPGLWTGVGTLACVRSDVNPEDVGGGERAAAELKRALGGMQPCSDSNADESPARAQPCELPTHLHSTTPVRSHISPNQMYISPSKTGTLVPFTELLATELRVPSAASTAQLLPSEDNFSSALLHPRHKRLKQYLILEALSMGSSVLLWCSPVCVRMCFCRSPEALKALLHESSGHLNGFSLICIFMWAFCPVKKPQH